MGSADLLGFHGEFMAFFGTFGRLSFCVMNSSMFSISCDLCFSFGFLFDELLIFVSPFILVTVSDVMHSV